MGHRGGDLADRNEAAGGDELLLQLLSLFSQLMLTFTPYFVHPLLFGQVAAHDGKTHQGLSLVPERADDGVGPEPRAILADTPSLLLIVALSGRLPERLRWKALHLILRRVKARKMLPNRFFVLEAFDPFGARVPTGHPPFWIQHENSVVLHALHQKAKPLFALLDGLLLQSLVHVEQIHKNRDFRSQDFRDDRLEKIVHRAAGGPSQHV